jgi:hypothetical protein
MLCRAEKEKNYQKPSPLDSHLCIGIFRRLSPGLPEKEEYKSIALLSI